MDLGADDYLTKPFEESELLNAIEGRLKRSELFRKGFDQSLEGLEHFMDQARGLAALKDISADRKTRTFTRRSRWTSMRATSSAPSTSSTTARCAPTR